MEENNDILLDGADALVYLETTSIPNLSRKTSKWRFRFNPPTHQENVRCDQIFFWL